VNKPNATQGIIGLTNLEVPTFPINEPKYFEFFCLILVYFSLADTIERMKLFLHVSKEESECPLSKCLFVIFYYLDIIGGFWVFAISQAHFETLNNCLQRLLIDLLSLLIVNEITQIIGNYYIKVEV